MCMYVHACTDTISLIGLQGAQSSLTFLQIVDIPDTAGAPQQPVSTKPAVPMTAYALTNLLPAKNDKKDKEVSVYSLSTYVRTYVYIIM